MKRAGDYTSKSNVVTGRFKYVLPPVKAQYKCKLTDSKQIEYAYMPILMTKHIKSALKKPETSKIEKL